MSETNAPPIYDYANKGTLAGVFEHVLRKFLMKTDDMLPCKVIAVNSNRTRVTVQPLIKMVTTDNKLVSRSQQASVPVLTIGAGGFLISVPIVVGSLGWIKASDRDISLFMQSLNESPPNTNRLHSFEDGLFIPDMSAASFSIASADASNLVIMSLDGSTKISMGEGSIAFTSTTLTHNSVNIGATHKHGYLPGTGAQTETTVPNV